MKKISFSFIIFILLQNHLNASNKDNVLEKLSKTQNISFDFIQTINGKDEKGKCIIQYPKKIFCQYEKRNNKILVSNGKSLVIKTNTSYYIYPLEKTPLNLILNKNFLIKKIKVLKERIVDEELVNFKFIENETEISIFFDKGTYNLIGWQTIDIYQNLSITFISSLNKNEEIDKNLFKLPEQN